MQSRFIETNGIRMHVTEAGSGPAVVLCHGNPGLGFSWRHQLPALAAAGFRAIAPDQRGYGRTDRPKDPALYDANYVMEDMIGLLDALGIEKAIFVGHDFGAQQVCNLAVRRPARVRAVTVMACPYDYDLAGRGGAGSQRGANAAELEHGSFAIPGIRPTEAFAMVGKKHFFHCHYFQEIGPAERELAPVARDYLQRLFWALSAKGSLLDWAKYPSEGTGYMDVLAAAPPLPWPWLSQQEFDTYVAEFTGVDDPDRYFIGGLNSYRVADRNWELGYEFADANILQPSQFIAGAEDPVLKMIPPDALEVMGRRCPDLRDVTLVPDAGHFVQMEQATATNAALLRFLKTL